MKKINFRCSFEDSFQIMIKNICQILRNAFSLMSFLLDTVASKHKLAWGEFLKIYLGFLKFPLPMTRCLFLVVNLLFWGCGQEKSKILKPEENRFSKQNIKMGLTEPIALTISNDNEVFFCQRRGEIFVYNPKKGFVKEIASFMVDYSGGNGVMGLALDPNFDYNKHVYLFYIDTAMNYKLSRIKFENDTLLQANEKIIFSFKIDKEPGAHNGGTILFDKMGNLLISTGDNTPPWQANGYPPHDQRYGREMYDALRTASNSDDFRGKILRIKPLENGNYIIPDGNLFPKNGSLGKPEIYVMGCRNPWKMSIDDKTGFVYWGEVGPDAGTDSTIGPRGYDEINQAQSAGNFGWPLFVANNIPYCYVPLTDSSTPKPFSATKPYNPSKNNTGLKNLPIPQNAFIYYPYAKSKEFPLVGKSGRTACAGPVYNYMNHKNSSVRFPKYYNDKLFIYDWMRSWIMAVSMDNKGKYQGMEQVLKNIKLVNPTHIAFAPDGSLYILEYGLIWYAQNKDASLTRIIYSEGNRPPVPIITCNDTILELNSTLTFNANKSYDLDKDSISYEWSMDYQAPFSYQKNATFIFTTAGVYMLNLSCMDSKKSSATQTKKIIVGNTYPKVDILLKGINATFYFDNSDFEYSIRVSDKEDKKIDTSKIVSNITYIPQGTDIYPMIEPTTGHKETPKEREITENALIASSDCKSCHAMNIKSVGPSFIDISKRYFNHPKAIELLSAKIIKGGGGVWGDHAMSAHPQITLANAKSMVQYILSLNNTSPNIEDKYSIKLAQQGKILSKEFVSKRGWFYITSTYTDNGIEGKYPLSKTNILTLKNPLLKCITADSLHKCMIIEENKNLKYVGAFNYESNIHFKNIDMSQINKVSVKVNSKSATGFLQLRENSSKGNIIATTKVNPQGKWGIWEICTFNFVPLNKKINLYITFEDNQPSDDGTSDHMINLEFLSFEILKK